MQQRRFRLRSFLQFVGPVVVGGDDRRHPAVAVVDARTGAPLPADANALRFVSVPFAWSPDGAWLFGATATRDLVAVRVADGAVHRLEMPAVDRTIAGLFVRPTARD